MDGSASDFYRDERVQLFDGRFEGDEVWVLIREHAEMAVFDSQAYTC